MDYSVDFAYKGLLYVEFWFSEMMLACVREGVILRIETTFYWYQNTYVDWRVHKVRQSINTFRMKNCAQNINRRLYAEILQAVNPIPSKEQDSVKKFHILSSNKRRLGVS